MADKSDLPMLAVKRPLLVGVLNLLIVIAGLAAFAGIEAPSYMVEAGPAENPGGVPIGREFRVELHNEHLQYVIVWFSLAASLMVIYVLSQRGPLKPSEPDESAD